MFLKNGFVICFFNENSNISPMIFHSQPLLNTRMKKRHVQQKKFHFPQDKCFLFKFRTLYVSKINPFLDLKRNTTIRQKLRTN